MSTPSITAFKLGGKTTAQIEAHDGYLGGAGREFFDLAFRLMGFMGALKAEKKAKSWDAIKAEGASYMDAFLKIKSLDTHYTYRIPANKELRGFVKDAEGRPEDLIGCDAAFVYLMDFDAEEAQAYDGDMDSPILRVSFEDLEAMGGGRGLDTEAMEFLDLMRFMGERYTEKRDSAPSGASVELEVEVVKGQRPPVEFSWYKPGTMSNYVFVRIEGQPVIAGTFAPVEIKKEVEIFEAGQKAQALAAKEALEAMRRGA